MQSRDGTARAESGLAPAAASSPASSGASQTPSEAGAASSGSGRARPQLSSDPRSAGEKLEERYRSLFVIGRGGMGTVEVALERGAGDFSRIVALKRLLRGTEDPRHVEMFLREARLAALLNHPNVVHAFDFGELRGELFLALEYVEGQSLSRILRTAQEKEGGIVPALVAHIVAETCDGLHAAHELCDVNGQALAVVHRDISPHNVMISYAGHVKLLDFGVAKIEAEPGMTRTGEVKGKMAYMSPEQAMGEPLDRRSDLFGVGAMLFECLAGQRMWGEGTDMEVLRKLALEAPPDLSAAAPGVPPELCALYKRLIAKNPADRPPTARAVSEELRAFIATTGTRPDARVLAQVMTRLFQSEWSSQRERLTRALVDAAPERADELRDSLAPSPPSQGQTKTQAQTEIDMPSPQERTAIMEPRAGAGAGVVAANAVTSSVETPTVMPPHEAGAGGKRALWVVSGIVLAMVALALAEWRTARSVHGDTATPPSATSTTASSTPTPTPTPTPTSTSTSTSTPTPTSTSVTSTKPPTHHGVVPLAPRTSAHPIVAAPAPAPSQTAARHDPPPTATPGDLDEHPF